MTFTLVKLHEVLVTDEYKVHIDEYARERDQILLLHWRYLKWTPQVFKRSIKHWHALRRCVTAPMFALGEVDDDKWERFVTSFGFKFLQTVKCANGESRRLFIHHLSEAQTHVRIRHQGPDEHVGHQQLDG